MWNLLKVNSRDCAFLLTTCNISKTLFKCFSGVLRTCLCWLRCFSDAFLFTISFPMRYCQWSCRSKFWSIFLAAKSVSFFLPTCGNKISNYKKLMFLFSEISTHTVVRLTRKILVCNWNLPYLGVNEIK